MAALFLSRAMLLVLLVCDWAGDPYFGQSPLSREMGSQEVCCKSISTQASLAQTILQPQFVSDLLPIAAQMNTDMHWHDGSYQLSHAPLLDGGVVYLFMSINC
jgi:hypothetical protein